MNLLKYLRLLSLPLILMMPHLCVAQTNNAEDPFMIAAKEYDLGSACYEEWSKCDTNAFRQRINLLTNAVEHFKLSNQKYPNSKTLYFLYVVECRLGKPSEAKMYASQALHTPPSMPEPTRQELTRFIELQESGSSAEQSAIHIHREIVTGHTVLTNGTAPQDELRRYDKN